MLNKSQIAAITVILLAAATGIFVVSPKNPQADFAFFRGRTMGTTWSVKLSGPPLGPQALAVIQADIESQLKTINGEMSIYDPESSISILNRLAVDVPMELPDSLYHVLRFSLDLAGITGGAFDPTVGPLVNLWGFGPDGMMRNTPDSNQTETARARVGFHKLQLFEPGAVQKSQSNVYVDLGAVAKGYGVDAVVAMLASKGYSNCLVEIGGEVRALGMSTPGHKWRVGVQRPNYNAKPGAELQGILHLSNISSATSGDYQNFYVTESGTMLSHIIDPRTARPVGHTTAGVTVLAPNCMPADGWATALYVLGPDAGLPLVELQPEIEALFVVREADGTFREFASSGFAAWSEYEPAGLEKSK